MDFSEKTPFSKKEPFSKRRRRNPRFRRGKVSEAGRGGEEEKSKKGCAKRAEFTIKVKILSTGEIQKGTGGRGRDRKCHKLSWRLSQIVVTFYDDLWRFMTFYDVLCQWNKEAEIVIKCRKLSWHVVNCRKLSWRLSQIVVTFFFPSPSRRPLLDFADSKERFTKTSVVRSN